MQPNAVFASIVDRKPYEQLSNEELAVLQTKQSSSGSVNKSGPFKNKGGKQSSNLMFGSRDDSVELMMQNSTSLGGSTSKNAAVGKKNKDVAINEQSSDMLEASKRTGHDPGYLLPFDFTGELS